MSGVLLSPQSIVTDWPALNNKLTVMGISDKSVMAIDNTIVPGGAGVGAGVSAVPARATAIAFGTAIISPLANG